MAAKILIAALAAALLGSQALAQTEPPASAPPAAEESQAVLVGKPVWTSDGKEAGIVAEVLQGADGKVEALYVSVGQFLGLGERMVRVAAELVLVAEDRLQLAISFDELHLLPEVAPRA